MKTLKQLLDAKEHHVWSINLHMSVFEAIQMMDEKHVGALVVMDGQKVAGIISERDYARKVILKGRSSKETPIRDVMTTRVVFARLHRTVEECMVIMTEKRIRHLPVLNAGQVVGMISIGDLVKAVIEDQRFTINQLEDYIGGNLCT